MTSKPIITQGDLLRLADLLRTFGRGGPELGRMERTLRDARVVAPEDVPPDVVTIGSRFRFTDVRTGASDVCRLVLPDEADPDDDRLSVFAPIGTAVLGRRAGQTAWWEVPDGVRAVTIDDVLPCRASGSGDDALGDHEDDEPADAGGDGGGGAPARNGVRRDRANRARRAGSRRQVSRRNHLPRYRASRRRFRHRGPCRRA
jgi:regulator of nucleoside diphosphate kinase